MITREKSENKMQSQDTFSYKPVFIGKFSLYPKSVEKLHQILIKTNNHRIHQTQKHPYINIENLP